MSTRPLLYYPDPVLSSHDHLPVTPDHPMLQAILRDLADTLDASPGVGLAAPQIGYPYRVILVDVSRDRKPERRTGHGRVLLLNPRILENEAPEMIREGCLSVPEFTGNVSRYQRVVVEGITPDGNLLTLESKGYEAVAFQHEVDHVNGFLFLDRLSSLRQDLFRRKDRSS